MANTALRGTRDASERAHRPVEGNSARLEGRCQDPYEWVPLEAIEKSFLPLQRRDPSKEANG